MSWWIEFKRALQTRLAGDATLAALLGTSTFGNPSIYQEVGIPEAASMFPYLIVRQDDANQIHFQNTDCTALMFTVQARVGNKQKYGTDDPDVRADLIMARVYGDWYAQSGGTPTYGLHKWAAGSLSSGYTAGAMVRTIGPIVVQDDNVFGLAHSYTVHVSKQAA